MIDVNGRTYGRTDVWTDELTCWWMDGRMENRTPISHPPKNKFGEKLGRGDGLMTSDCSSGFFIVFHAYQ